MSDEKDRTEQEDASEAAASGAGNPSVDEPTEPVLEETDDSAFREGVPEPGRGDGEGS